MRSIIVAAGLAVLLFAVGCNNLGPHRRDVGGRISTDDALPSTAKLVEYLNNNADRLGKEDALRCTNLAINCKAQGQSVSLGGNMMCQKPRNFRLQAKVISQPTVDIGSNDTEFWYWISKDNPPYLYHCSYDALARGTRIPFPFQPDMVVSALGLAHYDPNKTYELKAPPGKNYMELIEPAVSPQGQPIQKVIVFNRNEAVAPAPQVIAYVLRDAKGEIICTANIRSVQKNRETGVSFPNKVIFDWPAQKLQMEMQLNNLQVVKVGPEQAGRVFSRRDLSYQTFDLATRALDGPGLQRAGAAIRAPR